MIVVPGSSNPLLSLKLASLLNAELAPVEIRKFPDGEKYVRIDAELKGETVVVVQTLAHKPDEYLIELSLLAEAAHGSEASKVIAVIPYLAYARQDARFNPGEPISLKVVASFLNTLPLSEIVTVDAHLHRLRDLAPFLKTKFTHLSASHLLAEHFVESHQMPLEDLVLVGPDEESEPLVAHAAKHIKTEYTVFTKTRLSPTQVSITPKKADLIEEKYVLLLDDIISTGGTMVEAAKHCIMLKARQIYAACTHAILVDSALTKMHRAGIKDVVATDSIPSPISRVSIASLIASHLRRRE